MIVLFTNCEGITIYEKTVLNRAPAYIRHTTSAVYWQPSVSQSDGRERAPKTGIFINIPASATDYLPKLDDRVVKGICGYATPPNTAHTVMAVRDLRYGSQRVQHIEVDLE